MEKEGGFGQLNAEDKILLKVSSLKSSIKNQHLDKIQEVNSDSSSSKYSLDPTKRRWDPYTLTNIYEDLEDYGVHQLNRSAIQLSTSRNNLGEFDFKKSKSRNYLRKKTTDFVRNLDI